MAAPTNAVLFDFEGNYEDALQTYLSGLYPAYQVLTQRTLLTVQPKLITPRIEIRFVVTGTGSPENLRSTDNAVYRSQRSAMLTMRAVTRRNGAGQSLGTMRGQLRVAMLEATLALSNTALPYYATIGVEEASSKAEIEVTNDEIQTEIDWHVWFWIPPDQWAAS